MAKIHINIGSNKGDRAAHIERAVALLVNRLDPDNRGEAKLAGIIESEPWGFESPNRFLNLGLMLDLPGESVDPHTILENLQAVERELSTDSHRNPDGTYADREIDIDLIAVDDLVVDDLALTLPHPRMSQRSFVLEPVAELDPGWRHPLTGLSAKEMLRQL